MRYIRQPVSINIIKVPKIREFPQREIKLPPMFGISQASRVMFLRSGKVSLLYFASQMSASV